MAEEATAASVVDSLRAAGVTEEEAARLGDKFNDPEFRRLFEEYAQEVSNPKARAENEAYLAQLEADGEAEAVYGKGVQLVVPEPGLVVKTKTADGASRVYINVCTSPKVAAMQLDAPSAPGARPHLSLPNMLSAQCAKRGVRADGTPLVCFDFVVHPGAVEEARRNAGLRDALAVMAIEQVELRAETKLLRTYKLPRKRYQGANGEDKPSVLSLRTAQGGEAVGGRLRPLGSSTATAAAADTSTAGLDNRRPGRSSFTFAPKARPPPQQQQQQQPQQQQQQQAGPAPASSTPPAGVVTPVFQVVERARVQLGDAWDAGRRAPQPNVPEALVVRVQLPGITSASAVQLDIGSDRLQLEVAGRFLLQLPLRFEVSSEHGQAKFDKERQLLVITLPVVAPEEQAQPQLQEMEQPQQPEQQEEREQPQLQPQLQPQQPEQHEQPQQPEQPEQPPQAQQATEEGDAATVAAPESATENELRWAALHASTDAPEPLPQAAQPAAARLPPQPVLQPRLSSRRVCASDFA